MPLVFEPSQNFRQIVNAQGVTTDPDMIKDIVEFPFPRTGTQVRQFIGLVGSYRDFIKDFNLVAEPLIRLTRKEGGVSGEEQRAAFNKLIALISSAPILVHPDVNKKKRVQTDASKVGAGAVLLQLQDDGVWHPISFASWLFNSAQRNYSTTDRELLSIILALRKWRDFVIGQRLIVQNDHKPINGYVRAPDPHGRLARWDSELSAFNLSIEHIMGVK